MILEVSQLRRWVLLPELKLMELKTRNLQNYMGLALVFQARMKDIHLTVMGLTKSLIAHGLVIQRGRIPNTA